MRKRFDINKHFKTKVKVCNESTASFDYRDGICLAVTTSFIIT